MEMPQIFLIDVRLIDEDFTYIKAEGYAIYSYLVRHGSTNRGGKYCNLSAIGEFSGLSEDKILRTLFLLEKRGLIDIREVDHVLIVEVMR